MLLFALFNLCFQTENRITQPPQELGHRVLSYHVKEENRGLICPVYDRVGCAISLNVPYEAVWFSNEQAYVFHEFSPNTVIVKNREHTDYPAQVFFLVEGYVVEVLLTPTDMEHACRRLMIELLGLPSTQPKIRVQSQTTAPTAPNWRAEIPRQEDSELGPWLLPLKNPSKTQTESFGALTFGKDATGTSFLFLNPSNQSAPISKLEVVRARKKRFSKTFTLAYPIPVREYAKESGERILLFDRFALEKREKVYARVMQEGGRTPLYIPLDLGWQ